MILAFFLAALRRHVFSIALTLFTLAVGASLFDVSVLLALGVWALAAIVLFELWYELEPFALRRFCGLRSPSHAEAEVLQGVEVSSHLEPLISKAPGFMLRRGMRCLIVGRDTLDLLEQRALTGVLYQAALPMHQADLAGCTLAWLGGLPVVAAWLAARGCGVLGRLVGLVAGEALVLPLVLWRDGFLRWSGRLFGALIVGLLAAALLSDGYAAFGFELAVAWLAVPAIAALLAWESARVERAADRLTVEAGYGWQLLEALELLVVAEPVTSQSGLFAGPRSVVAVESLTTRAHRIREMLAQ